MIVVGTVWVRAQTSEAEVLEFLKPYDVAFNARDMNKLATLYRPDVTICEGSGTNRGRADYRDNHLGPEMQAEDSKESKGARAHGALDRPSDK